MENEWQYVRLMQNQQTGEIWLFAEKDGKWQPYKQVKNLIDGEELIIRDKLEETKTKEEK